MHISFRTFILFCFIPGWLSAGSITVGDTVKSKKTGVPISQALVTVTSLGGALIDSVRTNANGVWSVSIPVSSVDDGGEAIPRQCTLGQNYPNPFNPSTRIPFTITADGVVRLFVHNILGQQIAQREVVLRSGSYEVDWRTSGSAGVLFYTIEMDGRRSTRKMVQLDGGGMGGFGSILTRGTLPGPNARRTSVPDSIRIVSQTLTHEPDTLVVPLIDGTPAGQRLETVHDRAFVIDLHNDVLEQIVAANFTYQIGVRNTVHQTDIPRLRDGGVDAQVLSVWVTTGAANYYSNTLRYLDTLKAQISRNRSDIEIALAGDSVETIHRRGAIAGILMMEGGECIEGSLDKLRDLYSRGMRIMTITWNNRSGVSWARAHNSTEALTIGLNGIGADVIRLMDSLGIIIDVSHVGIKTVDDILATTRNPVIASHSCARALRENTRNLTDAQIRAIAQRGGVIGVNFYPPFVGAGTVTLDSVIKHIDYIRNLVGIDYIALGSDFDGIESTPVGLEDVTDFPALTESLLRRGYSRADVRKLLGENALRVIRAVCR